MRAAVVTRYGGPEVVELRDVPAPSCGDDELLVDVHAASVNPVDFKIRDGKLKPILRYRPPFVLGNDLSGVVAAVGGKVTRFRAGDVVFARAPKDGIGTFEEQANRGVHRAARRAGARYHYLFMRPDGEQLAALGRLVDDGALWPIVDRSFPLAQAREAMAHVEAGHSVGKVVIAVRP